VVEGGIRVPGLLEWPSRVLLPFRCDIPVASLDFYPTICAMHGIKMPNQPEPIDGMDIMPIIERKVERRAKPLGFEWCPPEADRARATAWVDNEYKFLSVTKGKQGNYPVGEYLFDLKKDPTEQTDIKQLQPEIFERLKKEHAEWQASVTKSMAEYQWTDEKKK